MQARYQSPASVAGLPFINQSRPFFPGNFPQIPSASQGAHTSELSGFKSMNDSGSRGQSLQESAGDGMMHVDGEGIRKEVRPSSFVFRGDTDSTAQSMINASTELHGNPLTQVDHQNVEGNLFAKVAQYQAQRFYGIAAAEQEQVPVAEQETPRGEMEVDIEENLAVASSTNAQIDRDYQETPTPQSLPLPAQSFVRDTYDSTTGGSTTMKVDQDESAGMPLPSDANRQKEVQGTGESVVVDAATDSITPAQMPRDSSPEQDMTSNAPRQETVAQTTAEGSSVSDVQGEVDDTHVDNLAPVRSEDTAVAAPSRQQPAAQAQSLRRSQQANPASNRSEGAAAPSREIPLVHPQPHLPHPRTVNMEIMQLAQDVQPHHPIRPVTPAPDQSDTRPSRTRTAEPQVTKPAADAYTPKRIVHRSTSSSRSGRILSSRTSSKEQMSMQVDNATPPVERAPPIANGRIVQVNRRTHDTASDENRGARTALAQEHSSRTGMDGANATFARGSKQNHPHGAQAKAPQAIRTEDHAVGTDASKTASESRKSKGGDLTGNARFQQMIQQSSRRGQMTADQLAAARAAALPLVDLRLMKDAINPPFVNASKAEKEALLARFLSRSSSPSTARAMKGHPRAEAVQERRHGVPKTPQLPPQASRMQSPGSGTQDEQLAMDLILRAKNREAEIIKLKQEIEMLEQQNASLEKLNADLVEEKAAACKENEAILMKKKDAIIKARKLIAASQNMSVIR